MCVAVAQPRNDRFFYRADGFTTSLQPFFSHPFPSMLRFFFFSSSSFFQPCAFVRSSFRSNSICHADGSFDNILPLDLYVSRWTTGSNNSTKNSTARVYVRHNGVALSILLIVHRLIRLVTLLSFALFFPTPLFPLSSIFSFFQSVLIIKL